MVTRAEYLKNTGIQTRIEIRESDLYLPSKIVESQNAINRNPEIQVLEVKFQKKKC